MTTGLFWRVFGRSEVMPDQEALAAFLAGHGAVASFSADETGWFRVELVLDTGPPLVLERWLSEEEGIRAELNAWAGFLETCDYSPHHVALMERCIQTRQLFISRKPIDCSDDSRFDRVSASLCRELAQRTDGFYQADGLGLFEADGALLVQEY